MIEAVLGAVFEIFCDDKGREYAWVKWWPVMQSRRAGTVVRPQVVCVPVVGWPAGARDWTRGRHWDRRSRYGEK